MAFKNNHLPVATVLQSKGKLLSLAEPVVMGILNITPDSFFPGSRYGQDVKMLKAAAQMLDAGATILDIGGASSRPGAEMIEEEEELKRVIPVIEAISKRFPDAWISIDTWRSKVATEAINMGAFIVNDISAGELDAEMIKTVAMLKVPYIAMHMKGTPAHMQDDPQYENVTEEVISYLEQKVMQCRNAGITDIILDPGFGFGKTIAHNYQLLDELSDLRLLACPILAGLSRKGMISKTLGITSAEALNGTTALNMVALQQGASILRVHDVKEAVEAVKLFVQLS